MIEILQILIIFFIFSLMCFVPFNVLDSKIFNKKSFFFLDIATFNLIINFNILLLLSILPTSLDISNLIYLILYISLFIYLYLLKNYKLNLLKDFFQFKIIFFIIFLILSINVAGELNLGWDAKYFYYIKALFYIQGQNFSDLENFTHNIYHPHLGSYLWAFFSNILPLKFEYFGRLLYVYLFCFSIFYVCHTDFKEKFISNIIFVLAICVAYNYGRFSGLQEILIFSILAILSKFYFNLKNSQNMPYIFFIILGCNLLIWLKAEGIVYATILILLINFSNKIQSKTKIYINLFYALLIFFKIIVYQFFNMKLNGQPFYALDYILSLNFITILYKIKILFSYLIYYGINNFFFVSGLIILLTLNIQKKSDNYLKIINYYFISTFLFIIFAYLLRNLEIEYFVKTTLERIVFISSGFYVFLVINFFNNFSKKHLK